MLGIVQRYQIRDTLIKRLANMASLPALARLLRLPAFSVRKRYISVSYGLVLHTMIAMSETGVGSAYSEERIPSESQLTTRAPLLEPVRHASDSFRMQRMMQTVHMERSNILH
jgi:hypothetical protein